MSHRIFTTDEIPVNTKQYRFPPIHKEEITRQVGELLKNNLVKSSISPYNSPIWIVPKKADSHGNKRWRMVIDYRQLNEKTIGDAYPLPNICDILDQLGGAKYFSVLDLASGFHQIPMLADDAHKTAFSTPHGHYQFERMPFGLKNAPATFQRLMDQVLSGLQGTELFVYMDDIVVYASSLQQHDAKIKILADRLRAANLLLQPDKCEFLRREVAYLGHVIGENGTKPDPSKITAIQNFPVPKNPKNIKQFLGLAGYYRRYIPSFSRIANPLSKLLKKNATFAWADEQHDAFTILKNALCSEPILQYPNFSAPFILTTDASKFAIGGVLSQGTIGQDLPVAYASRVLNPAEQNYATIEKELLAITYCVHYFRPYLYGREFTLVTDHQPLTWLYRVKDPTSRLMRWRLKLEEYNYKIIYKKGSLNRNADALSRNPPLENLSSDALQNENSVQRVQIFPIRKKPRLDHTVEYALTDDEESVNDEPTLTDRVTTRAAKLQLRQQLLESQISANPAPENSKSPEPVGPSPWTERLRQRKIVPIEKDFHLPSTSTDLSPFTTTESPEISGPLCEPSFVSEPSLNSEDLDENAENFTDLSDESDLSDPEEEPNQTHPPASLNMRESRDDLLTLKDNLVILVSADGHPFDEGAKFLTNLNKLPQLTELTLGRARVLPFENSNKTLIVLTTKERRSTILDIDVLIETLHSLLDVVQELSLKSFSIAKSNSFNDVPWNEFYTKLTEIFADKPITITICLNLTTVPPEEERTRIIEENHTSTFGGHQGVTKTFHRIRQNYRWDHLKVQIQNYIRRCRTCQIKKLVRLKTRQPMILTDTPDAAFDKVALDILGPLPKTRRGRSYLLTIQDLLTKYSIAIPLSHATAEATAVSFVDKFICRFGCPKAILTDQGTNFTSRVMQGIAKQFKIQHFKTTAFHPQSNGSLERSHHVLCEYLKCFIEKEPCWDTLIERASFAYNTSVHEGTKFTPHELVFGRAARLPSSRVDPSTQSETYPEYLVDLFHRIRDLQETAKANLELAKIRSKNYYDRRINEQNFQAGDDVFMLTHGPLKFSDQYSGPYRILEILDNGNVRIDYRGTSKVVHPNRLRISRGAAS